MGLGHGGIPLSPLEEGIHIVNFANVLRIDVEKFLANTTSVAEYPPLPEDSILIALLLNPQDIEDWVFTGQLQRGNP